MSQKTAHELLEEAGKVSSVIATARRLVAEGKSVDLSNLESKIAALCENAKAAELEQSSDVQDALSAILGDLNLLEDEVAAHYRETGGQALEDNIKRAIDAYGPEGEES